MDVIALYKVGIKNCVAPLGTAGSLDQLNRSGEFQNLLFLLLMEIVQD